MLWGVSWFYRLFTEGHACHGINMPTLHSDHIDDHQKEENEEDEEGENGKEFNPFFSRHVVFDELEHGYFVEELPPPLPVASVISGLLMSVPSRCK